MPNCKDKFDEIENKAEELFGGNFVSLSAATLGLFGRKYKEEETGNLCSFSVTESSLRGYAEDGFVLITVPTLISVKQVCALVPGMFYFNLSEHEKFVLNGELIRPGRFLIRSEPRRVSAGGQIMRGMGMKVEPDPKLAEVIYAYALCNLLRRKLLIEKICVLCREEVNRRYGKTPVCFKKESGNAISIGAWHSQISMFNVLPIKRV